MKKKHIFLTTIPIIMIDQLIKYSIISNIKLGNTKSFLGQVIKLHYVQNTGGAFSIGDNKLFIIIILNTILLGLLIYFILKNINKLDKLTIISITMILGGGTSNLIDRIFRGYVIDYIDINYLFRYPVFNLADIFIVIGVVLIMADVLFKKPKEEEKKRESGRI